MTLFYITNLFSVAIAEEIIRKKNIKNPIAYITNIGNENYYNSIQVNMSKNLWHRITICPVKLSKRSKLMDILLYRNYLTKTYSTFADSLKRDKISEVFLPNITSEEEKILFIACKDYGIITNFFEEGTNFYFNADYKRFSFKKNLRWLLAGKYRYVTLGREYFIAKNVYCCFPDKYKFGNYENIIEVNLHFNIDSAEKEKLSNLNIDTLS